MAGAAQGHGLRTFLMLDWHSPQTSSDWRVRPEISAGLGRRGGAHWERIGSHEEASGGPALAPPGPGHREWSWTWQLGFSTGPGGVILLRAGDGPAGGDSAGLSFKVMPFAPSLFPSLFLLLILSFSFPSLYFHYV